MGDPVSDVLWMVRGAWVTMTLRAGCRLELFDLLAAPRTAAWLSARTGCDPGALARLLGVLRTLGLIEAPDDGEDGALVTTALGATLAQEHPSGLHSLTLMQSWPPNLAAWTRLDDAVRSGASVYEQVNGMDHWAALDAHPDQQAAFNRSMARRAQAQLAAIVDALDLSDAATVVDVGGGRGAMLAGVLYEWPHLTGVVADRPDVAAEAVTAFTEAGLGDRGTGVACDFFASLPAGADVYFLANVLHDWDDQDCRRILRTLRAAMTSRSRLIVVEQLTDATGRTPEQARDLALVDLHMLVTFGARERTESQYLALLRDTGFTSAVLPGNRSAWNLIEARPTP